MNWKFWKKQPCTECQKRCRQIVIEVQEEKQDIAETEDQQIERMEKALEEKRKRKQARIDIAKRQEEYAKLREENEKAAQKRKDDFYALVKTFCERFACDLAPANTTFNFQGLICILEKVCMKDVYKGEIWFIYTSLDGILRRDQLPIAFMQTILDQNPLPKTKPKK